MTHCIQMRPRLCLWNGKTETEHVEIAKKLKFLNTETTNL